MTHTTPSDMPASRRARRGAALEAPLPASLLRALWRAIAAHLEARRATRQLQAMSDHELADLGLTRNQIRSAVTGRARGLRRP
jgi:uncharacterized protein YjiS (DUF1127 family)